MQQLCYCWRDCQPVSFDLRPCFATPFGGLHLAHCAAFWLLLSQTWKPAAAVQLSACLQQLAADQMMNLMQPLLVQQLLQKLMVKLASQGLAWVLWLTHHLLQQRGISKAWPLCWRLRQPAGEHLGLLTFLLTLSAWEALLPRQVVAPLQQLMALLAGGVAALGGRVLHTAKSLAKFSQDHSSQIQQQMDCGSCAQKGHESGTFQSAAAYVSVHVCRQRPLQQFNHRDWPGFGLGTKLGTKLGCPAYD